jgi:hypothetical protein
MDQPVLSLRHIPVELQNKQEKKELAKSEQCRIPHNFFYVGQNIQRNFKNDKWKILA